MGALMRAHDWSTSPLGPPATWPQSLRTAVRLLLNTQHPMYIWWGTAGSCLYNDAYRQSIGPERHPGSLGRPAFEVWEEIWPIIGPQIEQVMAGEGGTWHEDHLVPITRFGHREDVYWTYSYSPIDDEAAANGVGGVLVTCVETTDRVKTEQRLSAAIERQRRLFQCAPGFITVLCGPNHVFEFVNDAYVRLIGSRELIGRSVSEAVPEIANQEFPALLDQVFHSGKRFVAHQRPIVLRRGTGSDTEQRFLDFVYEPIVDVNGAVTGIFVEGFDVTDRRDAELALRELNATLEARIEQRTRERDRLWRNAQDMFVILTHEGIIQAANPAVTTLLSWSPDDWVGHSIFEWVHPDEKAASEEAFARALLDRGEAFENRCRHKDGSYRWFSWAVALADDRVYATARHMTAEKQAQTALVAAEEALRQSQKMEAIGQLTGGIAHDFNNLLAGISGSLELLQVRLAQGRIDEVERYVAAAHGAAKKAAALTHRLLAFSRRQTLDPKPLDVNRLISNLEELIRRTVGPAIRVETAGAIGLWNISVDSNQLENALLNLCINARDAMPGGGSLVIETANRCLEDRVARECDLAAGQYVAVSVSDTGTGMTPEVIARAFDPFFTTKPIGSGTGLGLSMTYGFARQSGGHVRITSAPGQGTTVSLYLPRYLGEVQIADPSKRPVDLLAAEREETVLVVDDEPTVRMLVADVLHELGYNCMESSDGVSALKILQSDVRIDLLITDVGLPGGLNGRQVADAARRQRPALKVLFITGYAENAAVRQGHLEQGMHVLTKPFEIDALTGRIGELLMKS